MIANHVLQAIGNTPIVQLRNVVPDGSARIFVKLEGSNPTGSIKLYTDWQNGRRKVHNPHCGLFSPFIQRLSHWLSPQKAMFSEWRI